MTHEIKWFKFQYPQIKFEEQLSSFVCTCVYRFFPITRTESAETTACKSKIFPLWPFTVKVYSSWLRSSPFHPLDRGPLFLGYIIAAFAWFWNKIRVVSKTLGDDSWCEHITILCGLTGNITANLSQTDSWSVSALLPPKSVCILLAEWPFSRIPFLTGYFSA